LRAHLQATTGRQAGPALVTDLTEDRPADHWSADIGSAAKSYRDSVVSSTDPLHETSRSRTRRRRQNAGPPSRVDPAFAPFSSAEDAGFEPARA
jgi:hypothetical protein